MSGKVKPHDLILKQRLIFTGVLMFALVTALIPAMADGDIPGVTLDGKKVAILVGEGLHDAETLVPMAYLQNRGAQITVIGVAPGMYSAYNSDITIRVEKSVDDVSVDDFDAVVIPGGQSPAFLREHDNVVAWVRDFVNQDKVAAAICHGPQVLITAGVLDGREATGVSGIADDLRAAGAIYEDAEVKQDGNIITSRIPSDLPLFCSTIEAALAG